MCRAWLRHRNRVGQVPGLRTQNGQGNSQGEAASRWDPEDWIGITRSGGLMTKAKGRGVPWLVWNRFSILVPTEDLKSRWSLTQHRKALSDAKSFLTLCDRMDCSPPGFSVLHDLLARAPIQFH
ncbi:hypothetical protein R6Z07M_007858 [Ovis aries]